ncbi:hypothetical protein EWH99_05460 [Sporolactobacillus sp. THM7-7]|nr:hypothetical protein EWH99_05460 [Sporolactobacillus sp. THM7-7]
MKKGKMITNIISYRFKLGSFSGETKTPYYTIRPMRNAHDSVSEIEEWMKKHQKFDQITILKINDHEINKNNESSSADRIMLSQKGNSR